MPKAAKLIAAAVFILVLAAVVYAVIFSPLFKVKNIVLANSSQCLNSQAIQKEVNGQNIFLLSENKTRSKLLSQYHCAQDVTVKKQLPATLQITLNSEKPVAKIDGTTLSVFSNGRISQAQDQSLPTIFLSKEIYTNPSQTISDPLALFEVNLAAQLSRSDFSVSSIRLIENQTIAAYNYQDAVALFSSNKSLQLQVDSLQQVLAKAKIDATKIQKIDLRYDNPTIVFKEKSQ